jgi:hypothetical protein
MGISKFPTDNLYKFLAIFGLVIFIISYFYPIYLVNDLKVLATDLKMDEKYLYEKLNKELYQSKHLLESKDTLKNKQLILELFNENIITIDSLENEANQYEKRVENYNIKSKQVERWLDNALAGKLIGLMLMIIGFSLWYFKLQKYQDIIIKNEAMKIKNESEKDKVENAK